MTTHGIKLLFGVPAEPTKIINIPDNVKSWHIKTVVDDFAMIICEYIDGTVKAHALKRDEGQKYHVYTDIDFFDSYNRRKP